MVSPTTSEAAAAMTISYGETGIRALLRQPYILFMAVFASIGGMLFGYDQGVISGVLVMNNFGKQFPLLASNSTLQGWMVAVLTLGAMVGALANGPIADRLSRRWSILLANCIFLVGSIIQAAAKNLSMIFVGRFIAGLAIGGLSMVIPLYISELAPSNVRGSLVSLQQLSITFGIMIAFWIDYGTQHIGGTGDGQSPIAWRLPLALQCIPSLVLLVGTFFLPYSPRWLLLKDREEEAEATLLRIRRVPDIDPRIRLELLEIKAAVQFDRETTSVLYPHAITSLQVTLERYKSLITVRHLNRRLFIACLMQFIQQFTGINAIIYYAPQIFENIGMTGESVDLLATGVVGIIDFVFTIPAILFMDQWGRKKVLIVGGIGMSISQLLVATIYAVYNGSWGSHPAAGWACAAFVWAYIANFAFSIGCVNWIIPSEIFPPGVRSQAVGLAIGTNWLSNFIVALIYPRMLGAIKFGTFYFFLAFCVFLIVWVYLFVPETRGIGIEEMDKIFGGNQGEADMIRMANIRRRLGISVDVSEDSDVKDLDIGVSQIEHA
ncbi:Major facilitator-type transporter ecdD [Penicillium longicatenatum]|uniref:Major facilitator-type transporter ecdD n=1 Tax=Penicillium longicatenatum TaxID=1561947 RepID=UPI002546919A|nr:Major facilitator-type transporter ecdD [Penicillium longicatenatum]KAJ5650916.1 Major facilitator-type transporter ecdD [Penicillium longicatenatum]